MKMLSRPFVMSEEQWVAQEALSVSIMQSRTVTS